jgi:hypothetical protein
MWNGFGGFYEQGMKRNEKLTTSSICNPLKLVVFMDLGTLVIVVVLGWFDGLWS